MKKAIAALLTVALCGCTTAPVPSEIPYRAASKTEAAIRTMDARWFRKCGVESEGLPSAPLDGSFGALLEDYRKLAHVAILCITRHNEMVDYLFPIYQDEISQ